jgi:serine/threonine-protein kinase
MPNDWEQIRKVFHDAKAHPPERRGEFLAKVCGPDSALRSEVESLLQSDGEASGFLEPPARSSEGRDHDAIRVGVTLGHYNVLAAIGSGGMGEVWKARDTKLQREVAIKALPETFAKDPARVARLEREATLLAALNHPNIASIHGFERFEDATFLVLELVEGGTLADRIRSGPLRVQETLRLAIQIAEALEAAHEKRIIHKDLKPANIKVDRNGRIKVLDFGLAKALAPETGEESTIMAPGITQTGVVMGTPAYMSPEQARGEAVGPQTDVWAFGVMLFEMLTSVSPFVENTTAETLSRVLGSEPDYSRLPSSVPAGVQRLVRRCLQKDQRRRLQHMGDIRVELEEFLQDSSGASSAALPVQAPTGPSWRNWRRMGGVAALVLAAAIAGWFQAYRGTSTQGSTPAALRVSLPFANLPNRAVVGTRHIAISEDGNHLVYASSAGVWFRRMDKGMPVLLTDRGAAPFLSPDGRWVGMSRNNGVEKVSIDGGTPVPLAMTTERFLGGTWSRTGSIVYATQVGLYQVSEDGGDARLLVKPDREKGERVYAWPEFLPDGKSLLFTLVLEDAANTAQIALLDLETGKIVSILKGGSSARYVAPGRLIYASGPRLMATAYDLRSRKAVGDPVAFPEVAMGATSDNGAANFAVSAAGTLAFLSPPDLFLRTLEWIDRAGNVEPLLVEPREYAYARISPQGDRAVMDVFGANRIRDLWMLDFRQRSLTQLTNNLSEDIVPIWGPDGRRIFFGSNPNGHHDVYSLSADGAASPKLEFSAEAFQAPSGFTPDGKQMIVYDKFNDVGVVDLEHPDQMKLLLDDKVDEGLATVSPDGKWLLYESRESGSQYEIFVRPFPNVKDQRFKISTDGGRFPRWGKKGSNELYFVSFNGDMIAASVQLSPDFKLMELTKLFFWEEPPQFRTGWMYDVSPVDGRFLVTKDVKSLSEVTNVSVILNWLAEVEKQLVTRR